MDDDNDDDDDEDDDDNNDNDDDDNDDDDVGDDRWDESELNCSHLLIPLHYLYLAAGDHHDNDNGDNKDYGEDGDDDNDDNEDYDDGNLGLTMMFQPPSSSPALLSPYSYSPALDFVRKRDWGVQGAFLK